MAEIKRISHKHDQIMNWMITNPERKLRDCAAAFGVSQAWLSTVIHSDIFQARLAERQERVFVAIASDIPEKLRALGHIAVEKLQDKLESAEDPDFVLDAFDKVMHRLGYAPKEKAEPTAVTLNQQNLYMVDPGTLALARQSLIDRSLTPALEAVYAEEGIEVGSEDAQGDA